MSDSNTIKSDNLAKRKRTKKVKASDSELLRLFWNAPKESFFGQDVIAAVTNRAPKTLESDRWKVTGIPYRKVAGRILYRKSDVIAWLGD